MEGEHWYFDGKSQGEGPEEPVLGSRRHSQLIEFEHIERGFAGGLQIDEVESEDGDQHQYASGHGEEEKLDGCIDPSLRIAPDSDEEIHGNEHDFPKDIEEDEIEGNQGADHSRFKKKEGDHEFLHPGGDRTPGAKDTENGQEGGQENKQKADAIDPNLVTNPVSFDPPPILNELHGRSRGVEDEEERKGDHKFNDGKEKGDHPEGACVLFINKE